MDFINGTFSLNRIIKEIRISTRGFSRLLNLFLGVTLTLNSKLKYQKRDRNSLNSILAFYMLLFSLSKSPSLFVMSV